VVFSQNHDQVGNRHIGDRLSNLVPFEALKLAAGIILLSPFIPLIFMGEEYGENSPFPYFISHSEPALIEAVRQGRSEEFSSFNWNGELPDPQSESTFLQARLNPGLYTKGQHRALYDFYRELIRLRKEIPALFYLEKKHVKVTCFKNDKIIAIHRWDKGSKAMIIANFNNHQISNIVTFPKGGWFKQLDSTEERWTGQGTSLPDFIEKGGQVTLAFQPWTLALYIKEI
jgi:maltooligosyltrehalose trehalohydrolase